jgi:hypothetical protein
MNAPTNKLKADLQQLAGDARAAALEVAAPHAREIAMQEAAQCWCDPTTSDRAMDSALAEVVARKIQAWLETAMYFQRGSDFYQGIVRQVGELFGEAAKTSDDGSVQSDVLALKVPELVKALVDERDRLKAGLAQ